MTGLVRYAERPQEWAYIMSAGGRCGICRGPLTLGGANSRYWCEQCAPITVVTIRRKITAPSVEAFRRSMDPKAAFSDWLAAQ